MEEVGNSQARCSFCGASAADGNALVQGGGPDAKDLPVVQICAECVEACGEALQIERRIREARASQRPPDSRRAESAELGVIRDWTPFSMEGRALEWRAERVLTSGKTRRILLNVRVRGQPEVTVELDGDTTPSEKHAALATVWLRAASGGAASGRADPAPGVLKEWTPFEHQGRTYEWRAESVSTLSMRLSTKVSVRNPANGETKGMEFDPRIEPSVDEAVMAASAGKLAPDGDEDDLPDAVVT